jgi:predicted Holliday junction resolvase-like endonuclease
MLNRNDRRALRRNRSGVSWLCILVIILAVWIRNLYGDISFIETDYENTTRELTETQKECEKRKTKIDSLIAVINHKDTLVEITKPYKPSVRKDTTVPRIDSIKPLKKDTNFLKDTLK